jgi:fructose-1,6-bisphosphatase/inositol monophosphatase family enzyme
MTELFREFSMNAMGIRASGAAAVNLCHLAAGEQTARAKRVTWLDT